MTFGAKQLCDFSKISNVLLSLQSKEKFISLHNSSKAGDLERMRVISNNISLAGMMSEIHPLNAGKFAYMNLIIMLDS